MKDRIGLGEREYHYDVCRLGMDRDLTAAINLEKLLYIPLNKTTASSAAKSRLWRAGKIEFLGNVR